MSHTWIDTLHFFVESSEQNNIYFNTAFAFFAVLLGEEESGSSAFVQKLSAFSEEEFFELRDELKLLVNKDLELNERKVTILVAVLHYVCYSYLNDNEEAILQRVSGENEESLSGLRDQLFKFSSYVIGCVKPHFIQRPRFSNVIHKLESMVLP